MKLPKLIPKIIVIFSFLLSFQLVFQSTVYSQSKYWVEDPVVTEVGKNAERSRQLLYWIFTHPPSYGVPVLAQIWGISRNTVYALLILVIALTGIAYIVARRSGNIGPIFSGIASPIFGITIPTFFYRIGVLLIYITFSYVVVLGLIQSSEILSRFFIETYKGCDLFNIRFTESQTGCTFSLTQLKEMEKNYTDFKGRRFYNPNDTYDTHRESATTSILIVKFTTYTYNALSLLLIVRQVILWYLLMLSPFLAILMPFIFIRNTGYIWIGVFFQWIFYGPLVSLFLAGLAQIWKTGIPYVFDFTRINNPNDQVFPTSINILYGGPAQLLNPTNTANYIDTYVEYLISLVMIWVAMILPWVLLRIFRDYCCDILKQNNASLLAVLDKMKGPGIPPQPPTPPGLDIGTRMAMQLPFRKAIEEATSLKSIQEISKANTTDINRFLALSVSSLTEVARYEMNKSDNSRTIETLNRIANPFIIPKEEDRQLFSHIKKEYETRAQMGDKAAQQVLAAAFKQPATVTPIPVPREYPEVSAREAIDTIARQTELTTTTVHKMLQELPKINIDNQVTVIASDVKVPNNIVQQVLSALPQYAPKGGDMSVVLADNPQVISEIAKRMSLSEEQVKTVLENFSESTLSHSDRVEKIAKETTISSEEIREVLDMLPEVITNTYPNAYEEFAKNIETIVRVASETSTSTETVKNVLEKTSQLLSEEQILNRISAQTQTDIEKVKEVLSNSQTLEVSSKEAETLTTEQIIKNIIQNSSYSEEQIKEVLSVYDEVSKSLYTNLQTTEKNITSVISQATNLSGVKTQNMLDQVKSLTTEGKLTTEEIINKVSQEQSISTDKVKEVLKAYETLSQLQTKTQEEVITDIAKRNSVDEKQILSAYKLVSEFSSDKRLSSEQIIDKVSLSTSLTKEAVKDIVNLANYQTISKEGIIDKIIAQTNLSREDVKNILNQKETLSLSVMKEISKDEIVTKVAEMTSLSKEKVSEVLLANETLNTQIENRKTLSEEELVKKLSDETHLSEEKVKSILQTTFQSIPATAPEFFEKLAQDPIVVSTLAQQTHLLPNTVEKILAQAGKLPKSKAKFNDQVEKIAKDTSTDLQKVKDVLGTVAAFNLEKPEITKPKLAKHKPVSIEDYEEVKNMWANHYKQSEVPVSDNIKNRKEWLEEDIRSLNNILNLLTSFNPKNKEKGMKAVAEILPFLLLGGFSEFETVIYLKAKLQAAKLTLSELENEEKIKEEAVKEEQETLLELPHEKEEKLKTFGEQEKEIEMAEPEQGPEENKPQN